MNPRRLRAPSLPAWLPLLVVGALLGCGGSGGSGEAPPSPPPTWEVVLEEQPAAILSAWAGEGVVYAVGADSGDGPLVLRHSGGKWTRLDTGMRGDLWWVAPDHDGHVWMVGESGLLLRHDIGGDAFAKVDLGTDATLFGIFFADAEHGWTVGGWVDDSVQRDADEPRGAVFTLRNGVFVDEERVAAEVLAERAIFKVWGNGPNDLWMVGERGTLLHDDGADVTAIETGIASRLLTVHGRDDFGPVAVGGANNAVLLELGEGEPLDRSLEVDEGFAPALNGVHVQGAERTWVVGNRGFIAERNAAGDFVLPEEPPTELHLHAVTVDEDGGAWAVGGDLLSARFDRGLILYKGPGDPGREL